MARSRKPAAPTGPTQGAMDWLIICLGAPESRQKMARTLIPDGVATEMRALGWLNGTGLNRRITAAGAGRFVARVGLDSKAAAEAAEEAKARQCPQDHRVICRKGIGEAQE
jgi:hypothetical protein